MRPWQHVFDVIYGYLLLGKKMFRNQNYNGSWNFGPSKKNLLTVRQLINFIKKEINFDKKIIIKKQKDFHETKLLVLDSAKSKKKLLWKSRYSIKKSLTVTSEWYKSYLNNFNLEKISFKQFKAFLKMIEGIKITSRKQIVDDRGKIMQMLRNDDHIFSKFGEIYFSCINPEKIKAWHLHKEMTLNYCIIYGKIKLVLFDDRDKSPTYKKKQEIILSNKNYSIVTVPPMIWNGFKCLSSETAILKIVLIYLMILMKSRGNHLMTIIYRMIGKNKYESCYISWR